MIGRIPSRYSIKSRELCSFTATPPKRLALGKAAYYEQSIAHSRSPLGLLPILPGTPPFVTTLSSRSARGGSSVQCAMIQHCCDATG